MKKDLNKQKKTINSIREKVPNSIILLIECSNLNDEMTLYLKDNVDYFINFYNNENIRNIVGDIYKCYGDNILTIEGYNYIIENNIKYNNFFKISGRYYLSDEFEYKNFENEKICCGLISNRSKITCLYKIPQKFMDSYINFLHNNIDKMKIYGSEELFDIFVKNNERNVIIYNKLGIFAIIAVDINKTKIIL